MKWFKDIQRFFFGSPPIRAFFILAMAVCLLSAISPPAEAQQCRNGVCYLQPVHVQPVYVFQHAAKPAPSPMMTDQPGQPDQPPVILPVPDPAFSQCGPHGCYRPPVMVASYGPRCGPPSCYGPPARHSFATRRTVGVGVEFSWTRAGQGRWQ